MKILKIIVSMLIIGFIIGILPKNLYSQQEVRIRIRDGMPMIPVALPDFAFTKDSVIDESVKKEIYETLWNDLKFSRVFKLIPKEHYSYIQKFNPSNIIFKDWESIQANILISGEIEFSKEKRIVFSFKVYEVKSGKFIFGRNFGGKVEFIRLIAHRAADEMMKHFGEKPIFNSKIAFVSSRNGNKEIYIMDYDGKRAKRITYNEYIDLLPSWSFDNEKILYTSYRRNNPDLYMFYLYTGKTELVSTGRANYCADWSPENDKIVFTSTKTGNAEIFIKDMKSGKKKRLTFNRAIDTSPCWSYSGREIAFTSQRSGTPQIYIMDAEGTNVRRITYEGNYHDSPAWSPDGTRIAFVSRIEGRFDIYVHNLRSNVMIKLTENASRNENPSWSPDGRHIIFSSNRTGRYQLYIVDYDGTNLIKITNKGENKMPKWQKRVR